MEIDHSEITFFPSQRRLNGRMAYRGFLYNIYHDRKDHMVLYCEHYTKELRCSGAVKYNKDSRTIEVMRQHSNHFAEPNHVEAEIRKVDFLSGSEL